MVCCIVFMVSRFPWFLWLWKGYTGLNLEFPRSIYTSSLLLREGASQCFDCSTWACCLVAKHAWLNAYRLVSAWNFLSLRIPSWSCAGVCQCFHWLPGCRTHNAFRGEALRPPPCTPHPFFLNNWGAWLLRVVAWLNVYGCYDCVRADQTVCD